MKQIIENEIRFNAQTAYELAKQLIDLDSRDFSSIISLMANLRMSKNDWWKVQTELEYIKSKLPIVYKNEDEAVLYVHVKNLINHTVSSIIYLLTRLS